MQWYISIITVAGTGALGWVILEFVGRPIRAFFDLRRQVRRQMLLLANVTPPKPREAVSSSREIKEYDEALKTIREAQRRLRELGSQMLALGESEVAARTAMAPLGFDPIAAGRGLIGLSDTYDRHGAERAEFRSKIEAALRFKA
jgi:hypothetical protein